MSFSAWAVEVSKFDPGPAEVVVPKGAVVVVVVDVVGAGVVVALLGKYDTLK